MSWLTLLAVVYAGCAPRGGQVTVGALLSLTGPYAAFGSEMRDGIDLAVLHANAQGGIKGRRLRMVYQDDLSTTAGAESMTHRLVERDGAVAMLGALTSERTLAAGQVANDSKVPLITPSATADEVTREREFVFRSCFTDAQQGEVAARYVRETMKKERAAILRPADDAYARALGDAFRDALVRLGGAVVLDRSYRHGNKAFEGALGEVRNAKAEVIFVPTSYSDVVAIVPQGKRLGLTPGMFLGGDGWSPPSLVEGMSAELEGAQFIDHYVPDAPAPTAGAFAAAFRDKFSHPPTSFAAQGYDTARLLFDAMRRARDLSPVAIRDALAATQDFTGSTGPVTIDAERIVHKPLVVVAIKGRTLNYVTQLLP